MTSLQGSLLIASPELADPNFHRAVVLVVRHTEEGALGLVLNRPTSVTIRQVMAKVTGTQCRCNEPLYVGGPCEGPLMALHTEAELSEIEILAGLHFCGSPENLKQLVDGDRRPLRLFGGYAGWGPEQLEAELEQESWLVAPALPRHVFGGGDDLWERLASGAALLSTLNIKPTPSDPSLN